MTQRLTITVDDEVAAAIDAFMAARQYSNRSEAMRDLVRDALARMTGAPALGDTCVAAVSYVYNHHERGLSGRLAAELHQHHDISIATTHTHLDHDNCLEVALLKGTVEQVRALAESLIGERGVRFGQVNLIPTARGGHVHRHSHDGPAHEHLTPKL